MSNLNFQCGFRWLVPCAAVVLISGCVQRSPRLDTHFGTAVPVIKAQQILRPGTATDADPGVGVDGKAAKSGYDEYQKSYSAPAAPANVFSIGVGAGR